MPLTSPGLGARVVSERCYGGTESDIEGRLTGHAKGKFCRMIIKKTFEKGAFSRARWARENQRASPIWASDHRRGAGWGSSFRPLDFHIRINRTGPNPRLYYIITYSRFWDFPGPADLKTAHILQFAPLSTSDYHSPRPRRTPSLFSFPVFFLFLSSILALYLPRGSKHSVAIHLYGRSLLSSSSSLSALSPWFLLIVFS